MFIKLRIPNNSIALLLSGLSFICFELLAMDPPQKLEYVYFMGRYAEEATLSQTRGSASQKLQVSIKKLEIKAFFEIFNIEIFYHNSSFDEKQVSDEIDVLARIEGHFYGKDCTINPRKLANTLKKYICPGYSGRLSNKEINFLLSNPVNMIAEEVNKVDLKVVNFLINSTKNQFNGKGFIRVDAEALKASEFIGLLNVIRFRPTYSAEEGICCMGKVIVDNNHVTFRSGILYISNLMILIGVEPVSKNLFTPEALEYFEKNGGPFEMLPGEREPHAGYNILGY